MQDKKLLSLSDILSAAEAVSKEEMDQLVASEIEEDEEFLCDLPEDLIRLFCLSKKYYMQARQIMEDHHLRHELGEVHGIEDCETAHIQALQAVQQGKPIHEIFWIMARSYAGVSGGNLGIRKGGSLVETLDGLDGEEDEEEVLFIGLPPEKLHDVLTTLGKRGKNYTVENILTALFGKELE